MRNLGHNCQPIYSHTYVYVLKSLWLQKTLGSLPNKGLITDGLRYQGIPLLLAENK